MSSSLQMLNDDYLSLVALLKTSVVTYQFNINLIHAGTSIK